jgi:hypothetical protein
LERLAGLRLFKGMLTLRCCAQITDHGLEHIGRISGVSSLDLAFTPVTDSGIESFTKWTQLEDLWINGTKVTESGVEKLQQALPNCRIYK